MRLSGGSNQLEGRVEVCMDGKWGTVCHQNWNNDDARVVCRQLNHPNTGKQYTGIMVIYTGIMVIYTGIMVIYTGIMVMYIGILVMLHYGDKVAYTVHALYVTLIKLVEVQILKLALTGSYQVID